MTGRIRASGISRVMKHLHATYNHTVPGDEALTHLAALEDFLLRNSTSLQGALEGTYEDLLNSPELSTAIELGCQSIQVSFPNAGHRCVDSAQIRNGLRRILVEDCALHENLQAHSKSDT